MAALPETPNLRAHQWGDLRVVDLRKIAAPDLAPVLAEEAQVWREQLHWDLDPSIELIDRFVGMQALSGFALLDQNRLIGYSYFVCDEHKGLIGDLYLLQRENTPERAGLLLTTTLETLLREPGIRRAETQLLLLGGQPLLRVPFPRWFKAFPRLFYEMEASRAALLPPKDVWNTSIVPWRETHQQASSWLVAAAYRGHIDSEINDQYRSPGGARKFLTNIVQYPGCGSFFSPASFAAFDGANRRSDKALCGISLVSLVAPASGHITQLCVSPSHKGSGIGYELLRRSLQALAAHGCHHVSLTVTSANQEALRLYERIGFQRKRQFSARVWETR
jgi:ribosomal protein S18 acetylase RimI-like enzyme